MDGLLIYSLERISSLQDFYKSLKDYIKAEATKGLKKNRFGFDLNCYFHIISNKDEKENTDEQFMKLQEKVLNEVDILENDSKEGHIFYRIKNPRKLFDAGSELDIGKADTQFRYYLDMPQIHASNTLVMLITRFEEFMSNFLAELYTLYPEKYLDEKQIRFSEIVDKGIDEIRKKVVLREVDEKMRASYMDWFKQLQEHGMKFDSCADELDTLKEIYARRNIIIHNAGIVNESYIKAVPKSQLKEGDRAIINDKYLQVAFDTIKIIIYKIMIEATRVVKCDKGKYLDSIFNSAFSELLAENYYISANIFSNLMNVKIANTEMKTMSTINRWIAEVELHGLESVKSEIEKFDTSILDEMYVLAKELLLENYEFATKKVEEFLKHKVITIDILENWPMFKRYRNSSFYDDFKKSNPEKFTVSSFEINSLVENSTAEMLKEVSDIQQNSQVEQTEPMDEKYSQNEELVGVS